MLKDKDDNFLGDSITHNVQYADNVWQAHGTVDRGSTYTKEPLLDLLFEGFDYERELGDYRYYVARASTRARSGSDAKDYVAAHLQHDLYVLDSQHYSSSSVACSRNIISTNNYLNKAVALSNPVYNSNSATKTICLLGISRDSNGELVWQNEKLKSLTMFELLKYFLPAWHLDTSTTVTVETEELFRKFFNRYRLAASDNSKTELEIPVDVDTSFNLSTTVEDFVSALDKITYTFIDTGETGKVLDVFLKDFSIKFHNPDAIKLPFYGRGNHLIGNTEYTESEDTNKFKTRFIANSLSENLYRSTNSNAQPVYLETLNDIVEESIFTANTNFGNSLGYGSRSAPTGYSATSSSLAKDLLDGIYATVAIDSKDASEVTLLRTYIRNIDNIDTVISLYCPDVYTGFSQSFNPDLSWGIHFINEEDTENLFQSEDNTYRLFNDVIIGYRLADTLIANRIGLGGIYYLISQASEGSSVDVPLTLDIPLQERALYCSFYDCTKIDLSETHLAYYPTISAINAIYKLGHTAETTSVTLPEMDSGTSSEGMSSYELADEVKEWLSTECFIFKGNVYGDYVEELNFMQDLNPDSDVHFNSLRAKQTEIIYTKHQDSKYEIPYIEQTIPLVNNNIKNVKGFGVYATDALDSIGNILGTEIDSSGSKTLNVTPPFLYDYDKGDQADLLDKNIDTRLGDGQRVNPKNNAGIITAEQRLISPTIDELWTFLKYLTESDGSGVDSGVNERLPKFYGIQKSFIADTISKDLKNYAISSNTVNPRATANTKAIDILNWEPTTTKESRLLWSPEESDKSGRVELQFGGYEVTKYIEKVYDYEIKPFSRRNETLVDDSLYEYNTEISSDKNSVTGYLEKLYNSAILAFDLPEVSTVDRLKAGASVGLLFADVLDKSYSATLDNPETSTVESATGIFTLDADSRLKTTNIPIHNTVQRKKAFDALANILNYHNSDGETATASKHNHYKKYLENPKNLKEIERDLETIRQNLQTLAEFSVASFTSLGYADRAQNRGTLHQLHKNAYAYLSTYIYGVNNTIANISDTSKNVTVSIGELETDLNNTEESLLVVDSDKRVVFEDGDYSSRYLRENYDASVLDLSSDTTKHSRGKHYMYRPNETLLSEIYLAADGTWRSVKEHTTLPIIYSKH